MEGPTPVSALIHAATMVTAGVYMVCRCHAIFELAPAALEVVAAVGAFTALLAGTMALAQNDLKRILAYSTVSQLGLMFLGAGAGAYGAAMFHLFTHAFFKALLFLGAGSVMHAMAGELDVWKMGGLRRAMPVTFVTFLVGTLALTGAPLTAGFFSKDELLYSVFASRGLTRALWVAGLAASLLTALYSFRALWLVFLGDERYDRAAVHPHESPRLLTVPLVILAVGSVAAGYLWLPAAAGGFAPFARFLEPALGGPHGGTGHAPEGQLVAMGAAVAVFLAGLGLGWGLWRRGGDAAKRLVKGSAPARAVHSLLGHRYYVDEIYHAVIVRPLYASMGWLERLADRRVIDGAADGLASGAFRASEIGRIWQSGRIGHYALSFAAGAGLLALIPVLAALLGIGG
jgi:NADH-quinone oxidoreductase subunit L